jgi:hypothetical protein
MKRILILTVFAMLAVVPIALAGHPSHSVTISQTSTTLTATGTESGIHHKYTSVHIVLTATPIAATPIVCGGQFQPLSSEGDFPVSSGTTNFSLSVTSSYTTCAWQNVTVTDTTDRVQLYP